MGICSGVPIGDSSALQGAGTPGGDEPLVRSTVARECLRAFSEALAKEDASGDSKDDPEQGMTLVLQNLKVPKSYDLARCPIDLDLSQTPIGPLGLSVLSVLLTNNTPIRSLRLARGEKVDPNIAAEIGRSLRVNTMLETLDFTGCVLGQKGVVRLAKSIANPKHRSADQSLSTLKLNNVGANDEASLALAQLLLVDTKLACLEVMGNALTTDSLVAFRLALRANGRIRRLAFDGQGFDLRNHEHIEFLLTRNQAVSEALDYIIDRSTDWENIRSHRMGSLVAIGGQGEGGVGNNSSTSALYRSDCMPLGGTCAGGRKFVFGQAETVGKRKEMQDVVMMKSCFRERKDEHLFGVFDGHGGVECARFVGANFPAFFKECLQKQDTLMVLPEVKVENAFLETFKLLNDQVESLKIPYGCCAVVCFIQNDMIHTASVGDSLAVLGRREGSNVVAVELNEILKPTMESERMRIENAGGEVTNGRVGGFLAVSRALGDIEFQPAVSPVPSVECVRLDPGACSVLLACDGVWDVHHSQSAVDLVEATRDPQVAAIRLVNDSLQRRSKDNISVVMIRILSLKKARVGVGSGRSARVGSGRSERVGSRSARVGSTRGARVRSEMGLRTILSDVDESDAARLSARLAAAEEKTSGCDEVRLPNVVPVS